MRQLPMQPTLSLLSSSGALCGPCAALRMQLVMASVAYQAHSFSTSALSCSGSSTHKDLLVCRQDPSSMQAAVDANVAYQARNDPEYQQLVAQQQEMRGPGALGAMQVGQAALCRPLCLHVVPVSE